MNAISFCLIKKYFFIIIIFLLIQHIFSTLSFSYPTSIILENGDIFVIHKTGITITDPTYSQIKSNVRDFSYEDEQITESTLSKISISKFTDGNGYIVCIIKADIFIFSKTGVYKTRSSSILPSSIKYFSLKPYNFQNYEYHFIVAYIYGNELNLDYFKYDISENKIKTVKSETFLDRFYNVDGYE